MTLVDPATIEKNADRVLERVSPSQVEAFELCPRRWYNASIRGLREEMQPAAQRGTDVATVLEDYYLRGIEPEKHEKHAHHAPLARVVLPIYGQRRPSITMEEWVVMETEEGLPVVRGRYDLFDHHPNASAFMQGFDFGSGVEVLGDTKCRSSFRYAKTADPKDGDEKYLGADLQMNTYASALVDGLGLERIGLLHAYSLTDARRPPQGKPVGIVVKAEDLLPRRRKTIESVRKMAEWARRRPDTAEPLEPNTDACRKFPPKGCPYRGLCGLDGGTDTWAKVGNEKETETMSERQGPTLMERMKQQRDALVNGAPPPAAEAAAPAPSAPQEAPRAAAAAEDPIQRALKQIMSGTLKLDPGTGQVATKEGADSGWIMRPPTMAESLAFEESQKAKVKVEKQLEKEEPQIRPSDAPPPVDQAAAAPPPTTEAETPKARKKPPRAAAPAAEAAPAPAPEAEVKPTVGKAPKLETTDTVRAEAESSRSKAPKDLIIYVDCLPTKGAGMAPVDYNEWLEPIAAQAAKALGLVDWRLDFANKSEGALAAGIRANLHTLPRSIYVSGYSKARAVFLECVAPVAALVVKGITG